MKIGAPFDPPSTTNSIRQFAICNLHFSICNFQSKTSSLSSNDNHLTLALSQGRGNFFSALPIHLIIIITFRSRPPSNSQRKIPCQRPSSNSPFLKGTVTDEPTRLALICASEFSSP